MSDVSLTSWGDRADPLRLLEALRVLCWYSGELEGHDVLVRAVEYLRREGLARDVIQGPDAPEPYRYEGEQ